MPDKSYQISIKFSRRRKSEILMIEWLEALKTEDISVSARIKKILLDHIRGENQLDRIEAMLKGGQFVGITPASEEDINFDDLILDNSDL